MRAFVKDFPANAQVPQAMYRVAESSYFLDDLKGAEAEFTAFLAKSPEDALREYALPYLADTQLRLGKPDAAAANFQQSIKLFPQGKLLEDSRWGLAKSFDAQQKFPEALVLYREITANRAGVRAAQRSCRSPAGYSSRKISRTQRRPTPTSKRIFRRANTSRRRV